MEKRQYYQKRCWGILTSICQGMRLSSAQSLSHVRLFATPWTSARRTSCSSPTPGVYSHSCPLSWWCHPTVSSSVDPFSSHLQSFPASGSFQMRQLFTSGGQSTGVSALGSVLPPNIQNWLPLRWTRWISLQSKESQKSSSTPQFKSINSPMLSFLNSPTLKSIYDYWKNHRFE